MTPRYWLIFTAALAGFGLIVLALVRHTNSRLLDSFIAPTFNAPTAVHSEPSFNEIWKPSTTKAPPVPTP